MNEKSLKTGVLGLDDAGLMLLEAASKVEFLDIQAVADKNSLLVEKIAVKYDCQHFDDYRQFIMQSQLDCVLVAAGMHNCDEYIRMAMKKKIHILNLEIFISFNRVRYMSILSLIIVSSRSLRNTLFFF